ncbi:MAG: site-2 protease family protein [Solirubrobacterales bacterium]
MPLGSIRLGRLAGIPIGISPLWLVIVGLITLSLGASYYPNEVEGIAPLAAYLLGLLSALLLFASILLHELGHAIVARRHGVAIEGIDLWLLGGVAKMRGEPRSGADELRYAAAGPAVTAVIAALFGVLAVALPADAPAALRALVDYQLLINVLILGFNLIPAYPLDGGRLLRAFLWTRNGDMARATATAAKIGRNFAYGLIALGIFLALGAGSPTGLWFAVIGVLLALAGRAEVAELELRRTFSGHRVGELASFPAVTIPAGTTAAEAAERYFRHYRYRSFPVAGPAGVLGLAVIGRLETIPADQLERIPIESVLESDRSLLVEPDTDLAELLERPAFRRVGSAIVVGDGGRLGIVSMTAVERALRAARLTAPDAG